MKLMPDFILLYPVKISFSFNFYKMDHILPGFKRFFRFYYDGFREMPDWGRKIWFILILKIFIMFAILKVFFFRDFNHSKFDNDLQRSEYVMDQLINPHFNND